MPPLEKIADINAKRLGDLVEAARRHAVDALLILVGLLVSHADHVGHLLQPLIAFGRFLGDAGELFEQVGALRVFDTETRDYLSSVRAEGGVVQATAVAESLPNEVELRVLSVPGIRDAEVKLVWDPPWDPSKMSDEARLELGML